VNFPQTAIWLCPDKMQVFDCHFHIIDYRFPLVPNQGYLPKEFTCADYQVQAEELGIIGGAVVSGSYQSFDQTYLRETLKTLGPRYVGITQLPSSTADSEIISLQEAGVRAMRFNLRRGGSAGLEELESFANRVYELAGWHVELYLDSSFLSDLQNLLVRLPVVVIDHLGLSRAGLPTLLKLLERGVRAKASGFGRTDFDPGLAIRDLFQANPDAVMFGTDLPSTRSPRPFKESDMGLITDAVGEDLAERIFYDNAIALYRPKAPGAG
jgi:predicted TIM-barrel fold metal-dependent hydrolase